MIFIESIAGAWFIFVVTKNTPILIAESGCLCALYRVGEAQRALELPTWVPEFSLEHSSDEQIAWYPGLRDYFKASGDARSMTKSPQFSQVLDLQGTLVDEITAIGQKLVGVSTAKEVFHQWEDMVPVYSSTRAEMYPQGGKYNDAFWRTAMADALTPIADVQGYLLRGTMPSDEVGVREFLNRPNQCQRQHLPVVDLETSIIHPRWSHRAGS